jgi:hypothetical protein
LEIAGKHRRPSHCLQQCPMRAQSGHKRENDKNFAEPDKHEVQLSEKFHKVKHNS